MLRNFKMGRARSEGSDPPPARRPTQPPPPPQGLSRSKEAKELPHVDLLPLGKLGKGLALHREAPLQRPEEEGVAWVMQMMKQVKSPITFRPDENGAVRTGTGAVCVYGRVSYRSRAAVEGQDAQACPASVGCEGGGRGGQLWRRQPPPPPFATNEQTN